MLTSTVSNADFTWQEYSLQGVSRTFALAIPLLPTPLRHVVGTAYLLCRIADTIEDDAGFDAETKAEHLARFVAIVEGTLTQDSIESFVADVHPYLSDKTPRAERDLVANTVRAIKITRSYNSVQQESLARCVRIMSLGMADFATGSVAGLKDQTQMARYCYVVAGVVGEALTELFCEYSPHIAKNRDHMMKLAVRYGQGLQMVNILQDFWEDREQGACWLPRDIFQQEGLDLASVDVKQKDDPAFVRSLNTLIRTAGQCLSDALEYTLMIPHREKGVRQFCLASLGLAVLTLQRIQKRPGYVSREEVKITRFSVHANLDLTNLIARSDKLLTFCFNLFTSAILRPPATMKNS